jgi:hypothetical protein
MHAFRESHREALAQARAKRSCTSIDKLMISLSLCERVLVFLRQFQDGSPELLRYVGILPK